MILKRIALIILHLEIGLDYRIDRCIDLFGFSFIVKSSDIWKYRFYFAFIILSFSVLLMQLTSGQNALMQGDAEVSLFGMNTNVVGNAVGLIFIIPLYYFWKIDAIVPVLLFSNALIFILSYIYARKIKIEKEEITITDIKLKGEIC